MGFIVMFPNYLALTSSMGMSQFLASVASSKPGLCLQHLAEGPVQGHREPFFFSSKVLDTPFFKLHAVKKYIIYIIIHIHTHIYIYINYKCIDRLD